MKLRRLSFILAVLILIATWVLTRSQSTERSGLNGEVQRFRTTCETDLQRARDMFNHLQTYDGAKSIETVLTPLNEMWISFDRSTNLSRVYQAVHPDPAMREVAAEMDQQFSKLLTEIQMSRPVYDALAAVDVSRADALVRRFMEKNLRDFRRAGVDKDPASREKIALLQEELVKIGQDFDRNIREDVRHISLNSVEELEGLPEDYINAHPPGADRKIMITTDYPDYLPFISYAVSDSRRLELYKEYRRRGYPANVQVLQKLLNKREELAKLLGYDNYAAYATEDKMIKNPRAAEEFIKKVYALANPQAKKDYTRLLIRLQKDDPAVTGVGDWQKSYLAEKIKQESYQLDSREVRQYFPYEKVKEGLLDLTARMYQVSYKKIDTLVWHPSVDVYDLWDIVSSRKIGRFYLDMHPRNGKFKHAMMSQVQNGVSGLLYPEAVLVCNFPGGDGSAGLMDHDQVGTYFHEFGHLLHHLFAGNQPWISLSGISTEWDFVETPSILFEEWVWSPEILKRFAVNETGERIPDELIRKMNRARKYNLGLNEIQQMFYAAISLNYYNRPTSLFDPLQLMIHLQKEYTPFAYVDSTYMHLAFGHLVDYSATYYTYKWSEVIAKDLFSSFQRQGMENPEVAYRYRQKILEPGGSKDAADLVKDFLGRKFSFDAYRQWLEGQNL